MKTIWIKSVVLVALLTMPAFAAAEETKVLRLSEPVEVSDTHEVFGAPLPEKDEFVTIETLVEKSEVYDGKNVLVTTRIARVCQKKGCFFLAQAGAETVRISFQDYGFFIPTDSGGKTVTLAGTFERKPLSREEAVHYAEDAGEPVPETIPAYQYTIVATGVSIPRT